MRKSPLLARVVRLEAALTPRTFPRLVFQIFDAEASCEGVSDPKGIHVRRLPGECLTALYERAGEQLGHPVSMWAVYAHEFMNHEEELPASAFTRREPEPELAPEPVASWSDLAGIGRTATREELEKRGIIAIPPERLM